MTAVKGLKTIEGLLKGGSYVEGGSNRAKNEHKKRIIRNHLKILLKEIDREDSWTNARGLTDQTHKIIAEAKSVFPEDEISSFMLPIGADYIGFYPSSSGEKQRAMQRVVQIRMALDGLLDYCNSVLGDPVAQEFIDNSLAQASEALRDKEQKHPVLVASVFIRISIEQALRTLCRLNQIQYEHTTKAKVLNEKLSGSGAYPSYKCAEVQSNLGLLNAVIHGKADPPIEKVNEVLDWANRFISEYLPGSPSQI